jgi:hypothetical protein
MDAFSVTIEKGISKSTSYPLSGMKKFDCVHRYLCGYWNHPKDPGSVCLLLLRNISNGVRTFLARIDMHIE